MPKLTGYLYKAKRQGPARCLFFRDQLNLLINFRQWPFVQLDFHHYFAFELHIMTVLHHNESE